VPGDIVWMEEIRKVTLNLMTKYSILRLKKYKKETWSNNKTVLGN